MSEICKQSALREAEGPEPEPRKSIMTVLESVEGLGLTRSCLTGWLRTLKTSCEQQELDKEFLVCSLAVRRS